MSTWLNYTAHLIYWKTNCYNTTVGIKYVEVVEIKLFAFPSGATESNQSIIEESGKSEEEFRMTIIAQGFLWPRVHIGLFIEFRGKEVLLSVTEI